MRRYVACFSIAFQFLVLTACSSNSHVVPSPTQIKIGQTSTPASLTISSPDPSSTIERKPSKLIPVDSEWNRYTNYRLGFTMLVPKSMFHISASCFWNEVDGDFSYRPQAGKAPVVVIEGEDRVYITSKYHVKLTEPTEVPSGRGNVHYFGGCEWVKNNVDTLANRDYSSFIWEMVVRPINDEQDLEALIDDYYGACFSVGEIIPVDGRDYSRVKIIGDGKPIEESECLLRGMYVLFYSENLRVAATWKTGQMAHFSASGMNEGIYDGEMYASFEFLPTNK